MGSVFDFSPLFRSTVGFDRFTDLLEYAAGLDESKLGYPPYDIEKIDEHAYRITMAVAGFGKDDLHIETTENSLVVTGESEAASENGDRTWLHRGIAGRSFRRTFQLADFVKVTGARLENGLLHIDLSREVPEAMKPRRIQISADTRTSFGSRVKKYIEGEKKAA